MELPLLVMLMTSAPRYLPANSKELLVLVLFSMNKLMMALPFNRGYFLSPDKMICFIFFATRKMSSISSFVRPCSPNKCLPFKLTSPIIASFVIPVTAQKDPLPEGKGSHSLSHCDRIHPYKKMDKFPILCSLSSLTGLI